MLLGIVSVQENSKSVKIRILCNG